MLNIIKMDLYRLFKGKFTWLMLIIITLISAVAMYTQYSSHEYYLNHIEEFSEEITVNEQISDEEAEERQAYFTDNPIYSTDKIDVHYFYSSLIFNTVIGLYIAIFAAIFTNSEMSTGFIKNIAGQPSIRYKTIISKCISIFVFVCITLVLYFAVAAICSLVMFGYISVGAYSISDMLAFSFTQLLLNTALCIVIMCISELLRNTAAGMAVSVLVSIGIFKLIMGKLDQFLNIKNFSFSSMIITSYSTALPITYETNTYQHAVVVGAVYIVIAAAISIISKVKRDIN